MLLNPGLRVTSALSPVPGFAFSLAFFRGYKRIGESLTVPDTIIQFPEIVRVEKQPRAIKFLESNC